MSELARSQNFYVIVGSSAGALIGLQFVVLSLIANRPVQRSTADAGQAFSTPTIVHFGAVLGLSAILSAAWGGADPAAIVWGLLGVGGLIYSILVTRRMRSQNVYKPVFEDWLFHTVLPIAAYATLAISAIPAREHPREALFAVGTSALILLFTGIHNAWDAVTYHVFSRHAS